METQPYCRMHDLFECPYAHDPDWRPEMVSSDCSGVQYSDTKDYGRRIDLGWSCHVCLSKPMYHHDVGVWQDEDGVFHPMNTQTWAMLSSKERIGLLYG